jgi:hypothetical protein
MFLPLPPGRLGQPGVGVSDPQFGETKYTPDPTQFLHAVTDKQYYKVVDKETVNQLIQSIPPPRDPKNLLLSLADAYGSKGSVKVAAIINAKQIVFIRSAIRDKPAGQRLCKKLLTKCAETCRKPAPRISPRFSSI